MPIAVMRPRAADIACPITRLTRWVAARFAAYCAARSQAELIATTDPRLLADIGLTPPDVSDHAIRVARLTAGWSR